MILLKKQLEEYLSSKRIEFTGQIRKDSLLLTLGGQAQLLSQESRVIDPYLESSLDQLYGDVVSDWNEIELKPRQFLLCIADEFIRFNGFYIGLISTLSHVARLGLMAHAASFIVDKDFEGHLTFELVNLTPHTFILHRGMPLAKLVIFDTDTLTQNVQEDTFQKEAYYGKVHELRSRFCREFELHRQ